MLLSQMNMRRICWYWCSLKLIFNCLKRSQRQCSGKLSLQRSNNFPYKCMSTTKEKISVNSYVFPTRIHNLINSPELKCQWSISFHKMIYRMVSRKDEQNQLEQGLRTVWNIDDSHNLAQFIKAQRSGCLSSKIHIITGCCTYCIEV